MSPQRTCMEPVLCHCSQNHWPSIKYMFSKISIEKIGLRTVNIPFPVYQMTFVSTYLLFLYGCPYSPALNIIVLFINKENICGINLKMWTKVHKLKMKTKLSITCVKTHSQICQVSEKCPSSQLFSDSNRRICSYKKRVKQKR